MMKKMFALTLAALALTTGTAMAQQLKIAYVNSATILRELPEAQQAQKDLERQVKTWQDELERMGKQLQDELEDYQKKQSLMDPNARAAKERSLAEMQQRARDFQLQKFDTRDGEAMRLREEKLAPIQDKVLSAIETVAKEDGFTFVFDKVTDATIVLYADVKFDLTYKVLDRLKRGAAPKGKK